MRFMKLAMIALVAVFAVGAMAASSASATGVFLHPLFLVLGNHTELLFSGEGGKAILRGLRANILATIECEKSTVHGFALNKSPLAHRVKVTFEGKCEQNINGTITACVEPIVVKEILAELGLLLESAPAKTVGIHLEPSEGKVFVQLNCGGNVTTVEGAIIGEIPEKVGNVNQYNKELSEILVKFEALNNNSDIQKYREIDLLDIKVKAELVVAGFLGGRASEEADATLKGDGLIEICTLLARNCP